MSQANSKVCSLVVSKTTSYVDQRCPEGLGPMQGPGIQAAVIIIILLQKKKKGVTRVAHAATLHLNPALEGYILLQ
jgi:hypothetical protein